MRTAVAVAASATPPAPRRAPPPPPLPRRALLAVGAGAALAAGRAPSAGAVGFKKELNKKRYLKPADFADAPVDDLPTLELEPGAGSRAAERGDTVTVHFDVLYRGIDVASTRSARLLGANRSLPEPFTFKVGGPVTAAAAKAAGVEGGGGLFTGASGPTPPAALSTAVLGMRVGGKRALLVPPARGYGEGKGIGEAPPGADVELRVEVLAIE